MLCDSRAGIPVHKIRSARARDGFIAEPFAYHILAQRPAKPQENGPQEMRRNQDALTPRKQPAFLPAGNADPFPCDSVGGQQRSVALKNGRVSHYL